MRHVWVIEAAEKGKRDWEPLYERFFWNRRDAKDTKSVLEVKIPICNYRIVKYVPEVKRWLKTTKKKAIGVGGFWR
jgi:hypothetical protein